MLSQFEHPGCDKHASVEPQQLPQRRPRQEGLDRDRSWSRVEVPGDQREAGSITVRARQRLADRGLTPLKLRLGYSMGIGFPPAAGESSPSGSIRQRIRVLHPAEPGNDDDAWFRFSRDLTSTMLR